MVIADLKIPCFACQGSGFRAGFNEAGTLLTNDSGKCVACQGKGYSLTKLGKDIWELYQPMITEMLQNMPIRKEFPQKKEE